MTTPAHEQQKEEFGERLFRDMLGAVTTANVAIGERLGLYRVLQASGPLTSSGLASQAGISERYAREWLEQQAADGVLEVANPAANPAERQFTLPAGHASILADREDLDFMAPFARLIMSGAAQLPGIVEAFRTGGGVPWDQYGDDMREAQGDANRPLFLHQLAQDYLSAIPDAAAILGRDGEVGVAEIGSGMGWAAIGLARAYPNVRVDGYDLDGPSVVRANEHAEQEGVADRVRFFNQDAGTAQGTYDLVTAFECLHDMPRPVDVLGAMRSMLAPGGACVVMDERAGEEFTAPADEVERLLYGISVLVCLPDGMSHPPSVGTGTVMRPGTLDAYAQDAGFTSLEQLDLEHPLFRFYRLHP